jgi:hypothetical protein
VGFLGRGGRRKKHKPLKGLRFFAALFWEEPILLKKFEEKRQKRVDTR